MNTSRKGVWAIIVIIILIIIAAVAYALIGNSGTPAAGPSTASSTSPGVAAGQIQATFACDDGKTIDATFVNATSATTTGNSVMLSLSDGRQVTLPQAISANGARYANADESFVFWNVGNTATITENGTTTYNNCTATNNQ